MALLHFLKMYSPFPIRAIYINHQLQDVASEWGALVADFCQQHQIEYIYQAVEVAAGNLEQQAREARYSAFSQHISEHDYLVLAHHQQDQAETTLLRLFSGAGVKGLSAMRLLDQREGVQVFRPLLDWSREQIEAYAQANNLPYVIDPTNNDEHYDRAWARQRLWPMLQARFPKMQQAVARAAYLMQDADEILNEVLQLDMSKVVSNDQIEIAELLKLSPARQGQLLSAWMQGTGVYRPSLELVKRLQHDVIEAREDAQSRLHWNGQYFVRFQTRLYRLTDTDLNVISDSAPQEIVMQLQSSYVVLTGHYHNKINEIGLDPALIGEPLQLRLRQGGEKIHLHGRIGHWPLKKAIQSAQIPPWQRQRIQILSKDNVMLGVFTPQGFWLAQSVYCQRNGWVPQLD